MMTYTWIPIRVLVLLMSLLIVVAIYYLIQIGNKYVDNGKRIRFSKDRGLPVLVGVFSVYFFYMMIRKYDILSDIIYTIMISVVLAYLMNPIVNYFEKYNIKRGWGVLIIYGIVLGVVFIFSFLIIPRTTKDMKRLVSLFPIYFQRVSHFIDGLYIKYYASIDNMPPILREIEEIVIDNLDNIKNVIVANINKFVEGVISTFSKVISIILIPILTFYFIKDKEYFKNKFYLTIPKKHRKKVEALLLEMDRALSQFVRGRLLLALYVGVATTILLLALKVDFAIIIGVITGIADIIPYFGPFLGFLPAVFFALLNSPIKAIWVGALFIGIQWVENNVLAPKIIGESTGIHPITILLALIIGGGIFGVLGMIFSIPVVAIVKILLDFVMENVGKTSNME